MKKSILLIVFISLFSACTQMKDKTYEKYVLFPIEASEEEKIDMISRLVPTKQQLEWQQMELTAFLHFGINTFTGNEWGDGKDKAEIFNPSQLDCEQWVKALKQAGFKMAILTAKHHDGFCLWPTATTEYSVKNSPWLNGKGDVVKELRNACEKYGIKFGVYLSPWDRNAKSYGDSPEYNKFFIAQLTELLTNYGEVHEVWFDGACAEGANGKKQEYDWQAILKTIRTLQPQAVTAIMGDDVRWVGNEGGLGRETEWSATLIAPGSYIDKKEENIRLGLNEMSKDIGSRQILKKSKQAYWYPSEVDVSIRPGWFYHSEQDEKVRSLSNLVDIYFQSVGRNSVLLLNIPPDRRGLLHENDVNRIKQLSDYINKTFSKNYLLKGKKLWKANTGEQKEYKVEKNAIVNTLMIQEDISKGQRVEEFIVEGFANGKWQYLTQGTTIGYKRLLRFSDFKPEKIRLTILSSRGKANISNLALYYAESLENTVSKEKISDISTENWKAITPNAEKAIDSNVQTSWKTNALQSLVIDMGRQEEVKGFCYVPEQENNLEGTIFQYAFYVSTDGEHWTKCECSGEFSNIKNNPIPYFVRFGKTYKARYFKIESLREINSANSTCIAEIGILTK
jgi:alpha-L-fucosidase